MHHCVHMHSKFKCSTSMAVYCSTMFLCFSYFAGVARAQTRSHLRLQSWPVSRHHHKLRRKHRRSPMAGGQGYDAVVDVDDEVRNVQVFSCTAAALTMGTGRFGPHGSARRQSRVPQLWYGDGHHKRATQMPLLIRKYHQTSPRIHLPVVPKSLLTRASFSPIQEHEATRVGNVTCGA